MVEKKNEKHTHIHARTQHTHILFKQSVGMWVLAITGWFAVQVVVVFFNSNSISFAA